MQNSNIATFSLKLNQCIGTKGFNTASWVILMIGNAFKMDFEMESIKLIHRVPQHEKIGNIIGPKTAVIYSKFGCKIKK